MTADAPAAVPLSDERRAAVGAAIRASSGGANGSAPLQPVLPRGGLSHAAVGGSNDAVGVRDEEGGLTVGGEAQPSPALFVNSLFRLFQLLFFLLCNCQ